MNSSSLSDCGSAGFGKSSVIIGAARPKSPAGIKLELSESLLLLTKIADGSKPLAHCTKVGLSDGATMAINTEQLFSSACCQLPSTSFRYQTANGSAVLLGTFTRSAPVVAEVQLT